MRARAPQTNVIPLGRRPQLSRAVTASIPAPVGGWNARDALGEMDPTDAVILTNMFPSTTQVQVRFGHSRFATGLPSQVNTLLAYSGGTSNKLFGVSGTAVYEVTSGGAVGAAALSGLTNDKWQYVNVTTAGGNFLWMCNGADNVYTYDGTNWTDRGAAITGVTSSTLIGCDIHKNRIWAVQVGTLKAWYLPTGSITGAANALDLSAFAPHGGYLMAVGTWTMDAGYGMDDMIAFITSNGDCIIYRGTDPSSAATWSLVGVYWIGSPVGRRCMVKYKGDLLIITQDGLVPMSGAVQSSRLNPRVALTDKIQYAVSTSVSQYGSIYGWQVIPFPKQNMLILNVPVAVGAQEQYVMNTITGSWCNWNSLYANCWALFNDNIYFGSNTFVGKAWTGNSDAGAGIPWRGLQAYNYFGARGQTKRFTMFRPTFQYTNAPVVYGNVAVDFDQSAPVPQLQVAGTTGSSWDAALWDGAMWGGYTFSRGWQGTTGVGYCAAPNLSGTSTGSELNWISTDVIMEPGGFL